MLRINLVTNKFEKKAVMTNPSKMTRNIMQAWSRLLLIPGTMTRNVTQAWSCLILIPGTKTRNITQAWS